MIKKIKILLIALIASMSCFAVTDTPDTLIVAQDGSGQFDNLWDAIEDCRAFMDYHKVIFVKKGVYKEKVILPSWMTNLEILGENRDSTIITYDDHANKFIPGTENKLGTFRTYTVKVEGHDITFKNITIENNAPRKGQAVALHTEGDRLLFINCRILGNQDTVYTGLAGTRLYFKDCYIEGTTDFIFGPSTAWFEGCTIYSKINSYVTAASTPADIKYGYVFNYCRLTAAPEVNKVFLGRPWRPYAHTLFMNCELGDHIASEGWHNWGKVSNEQTARYEEYNNTGAGANPIERVAWSRHLTAEEVSEITPSKVFHFDSTWDPIVE